MKQGSKRGLLIAVAAIVVIVVTAPCGFLIALGSKVDTAQNADFRTDAATQGHTNQLALVRDHEKNVGDVIELVIQFKGTRCEGKIELERVANAFVLLPSQANTPNKVEDYRLDEVLIVNSWQEAATRVSAFKTELPPLNPTPAQVDEFLARHDRFKSLCPRK